MKHSSAIAFIGSADPWSDVDEVVKLSTSQGVPISLYKELNHSLEGYDVEHNIVILCDVMKKTKEFINKVGER